MKRIVELLTKQKKTISTMESCTGGYIVNEITNIEGASEVLRFSAVTYSNEFKIKMGVDPKILETYTVYSMETAEAMSEVITKYTNSDYGIGITGKLNRVDKENPFGKDNVVFISIYEKEKKKHTNIQVEANKSSRRENKEKVKQAIVTELLKILGE